MTVCCHCLSAWTIVAVAWLGCVAQECDRMDRNNLLQYRDANGNLQAVETTADWQRRRVDIVRAMHQVMGDLPGAGERGPLEVRIVDDADAGGYRRRLITYRTDEGPTTPAYLCIPHDVLAGQRRTPAVLCLHPTDDELGHKVVVGLGGKEGSAYAAELAERGYVTISPAYPQLANYQPDVLALGYASGTVKAIWDNTRALDLLASLSFVDETYGFGAIGHSLGGHNSIYTAVLDPRISVVVSSCGFDSYVDYYGGEDSRWQPGQGWCQVRYMPRLADYRGRLDEIPFDFPELLAALAPRTLYINSPVNDDNFHADSVDRCVAAALPIYQLFEEEGRLVVRHPDCGHNFPDDLREEAYDAIDSVLRP